MATREQLEYMLGKAILDNDFRILLLKDPAAAAKSIRIELNEGQIIAIENLDDAVVDWWAEGLQRFRQDDQAFLW